MSTFKLEIELGNDAMRSTNDIARALEEVAVRLSGQHRSFADADAGRIHDDNGNTVGSWTVLQ